MSDHIPHTPPPSNFKGFTFGGPAPAAPEFPRQPWNQVKVEPTPQKRRRKLFSTNLGIVLVSLAMVIMLGGGAVMIHEGTKPVPQEAPLPAKPDSQMPADQNPVGADGIATQVEGDGHSGAVEVENADTGGGEAGWASPRNAVPVTTMSTELMEPMSVFVPQAKLYSLARPSDAFAPSKYAGLFSIQIPDNPHRTVWHAAGGAMAVTNADQSIATAGTTFLGSHSGYAGAWGAYINTAYLTGGETIWTKDAQGQLQRWQVDRIRYMPHTEFPQEYWAADGDRRLVLATCGGTVGADGVYNENVFVEAKPVEADGTTWLKASGADAHK